MVFNKELYFQEMRGLVDKAILRLRTERPDFEIYTASIWTDPNASASSIGFESLSNSETVVAKSNAWSKKYYDQYITEGDIEQAKLFEPINRNCNPADFELRNFEEINNFSIPSNWEEDSQGECWDILEPILQEIGKYAFEKLKEAKVHSDFELSVNGRNDWYEFVWRLY